MYRNITSVIAVSNVSAAATLPAAERYFGFTISEMSHIVVMITAVLSVIIALFTACLNYKRGKK